MAKFMDKLLSEGYCDSRGAATCASTLEFTNYPKGRWGVVLLCVKYDRLNIYEIDIKNNIGERLLSVELKAMENLEFWANMFSQRLAFAYEGGRYAFTNFSNHKVLKAVFAEELNK